LISGKWKLLNNNGAFNKYDGWWSKDPWVKREPNATQVPVATHGEEKVSLFDLSKDEHENHNVALAHPDIVAKLLLRMDELADPKNGYVKPQRQFLHPSAYPIFNNGSWAPQDGWFEGMMASVDTLKSFFRVV